MVDLSSSDGCAKGRGSHQARSSCVRAHVKRYLGRCKGRWSSVTYDTHQITHTAMTHTVNCAESLDGSLRFEHGRADLLGIVKNRGDIRSISWPFSPSHISSVPLDYRVAGCTAIIVTCTRCRLPCLLCAVNTFQGYRVGSHHSCCRRRRRRRRRVFSRSIAPP